MYYEFGLIFIYLVTNVNPFMLGCHGCHAPGYSICLHIKYSEYIRTSNNWFVVFLFYQKSPVTQYSSGTCRREQPNTLTLTYRLNWPRGQFSEHMYLHLKSNLMYFRKGLDGSVSATLFGSISELELSEKRIQPVARANF